MSASQNSAPRAVVLPTETPAAPTAPIDRFDDATSTTQVPEPARTPPPFPTFAQPEQAEKYRAAVIEGNERALAQLRQALEGLQSTPEAEPALIARLQAQITERQERILVSRASDN
jgi:hypothetical protein